jgi:iron(II)-dependent oxidoreductase
LSAPAPAPAPARSGATPPAAAAPALLRHASAAQLAEGLRQSRQDTLATFGAFESALADHGLVVPCQPTLNPPLWELGHIGWFQTWWLGRNPQRQLGLAADPDVPRRAPARAGADALYDSSRVPHASRWQLPLPDADATRADLAAGLAESLRLLQDLPVTAAADADSDRSLYFQRLCLAHEDMHHEAALYTAQALDIPITDPRWQTPKLSPPGPEIELAPGPWHLGSNAALGFVFDNECGAHTVQLPATRIDAQVLRWAHYLPFVEAGGYAQARWWPGEAAAWLAATRASAPRYLRRSGAGWQQRRQGHWQPLDADQPACHLTAHEARAWCAWAGRRLPTEAEWERAALQCPDRFHWGAVWEWTASAFEPYPGFVAHPYRDYSAPWFGSRPVLRGASFATQPRLHHARYRNYFTAERNDIFAGFRSCAR